MPMGAVAVATIIVGADGAAPTPGTFPVCCEVGAAKPNFHGSASRTQAVCHDHVACPRDGSVSKDNLLDLCDVSRPIGTPCPAVDQPLRLPLAPPEGVSQGRGRHAVDHGFQWSGDG